MAEEQACNSDLNKYDWKKMVDYAERLIQCGIKFSDKDSIQDKRVAIVLLDQAVEILTKAFLLSRGYKVFYLPKDTVEKGLEETKVVDKERGIDSKTGFKIINDKQLLHLTSDFDQKFKEFHKIRNKLYHGTLEHVYENKELALDGFKPKLKEFYEAAFDKSFEEDCINKD